MGIEHDSGWVMMVIKVKEYENSGSMVSGV